MTQELTAKGIEARDSIGATWEQKLALIGSMYPKASAAELQLFFHQAKRMNLDPLCHQIHLVTRTSQGQSKSSIQVGIDGYRATADRTGLCAGNDDPTFDEGLSQHQMIQAGRFVPKTATATVYKIVGGLRCPFTATATWSAYAPDGSAGFMWKKMPFLMLGKCAEALALRKAFPAELGGVYVDAEMHQAGGDIKMVDLDAVTVEKTSTEPVDQKPPVVEVIKTKFNPVKAGVTDNVHEDALIDLVAVFNDAKTTDELEKAFNRFSEAYKKSPATIGAAWDAMQTATNRIKKN